MQWRDIFAGRSLTPPAGFSLSPPAQRGERDGERGTRSRVPSWHRLSGMNTKKHGRREEIRYSEAFKMEVMRELEVGGIAFDDISMKWRQRQRDCILMGAAVWQWNQRKGDTSGKPRRD